MAKEIQDDKQIQALREAFHTIGRALIRVAQLTSAPHKSAPASSVRRQLRISPKRRAQLKLQGRYMGYMRQLKPRQKARIKALKERNGFSSAIRLAKQLAAR